MVLETYEVVRDSQIFLKTFFLPPKLGKCSKNELKTGFFEFIEQFGH